MYRDFQPQFVGPSGDSYPIPQQRSSSTILKICPGTLSSTPHEVWVKYRFDDFVNRALYLTLIRKHALPIVSRGSLALKLAEEFQNQPSCNGALRNRRHVCLCKRIMVLWRRYFSMLTPKPPAFCLEQIGWGLLMTGWGGWVGGGGGGSSVKR
jgi:hypothetical protein